MSVRPFALALSMILLATGLVVTPAAAAGPMERTAVSAIELPDGISRLGGDNRYLTAVRISQQYPSGVPAVFVATGTTFPDALSAAAAAARAQAPLLLTSPGAISVDVLAEIRRLAPEKIYAIGGESAVSRAVFDTLESVAPTSRIAGSGRYETSAEVVKHFFPSSSHAFIATGRNFPDALAATSAAGSLAAPVLLVDGRSPSVPSSTIALLQSLGVNTVHISGGPAVVSAGIASQLSDSGFSVERHGGATRYETAATLNEAFFSPGATSTVFLATGTNFPDALAGAALAGMMGAPMFLTEVTCTPPVIQDGIAQLAAPRTVVLGAPSVVSENAANNIGCLRSSQPTISGSPQVGNTLVANAGVWTSGAALAFQWLANGSPISGANAGELVLTADLLGKRISVLVSGSLVGFIGVSNTSPQTSAVYQNDPWNCPADRPIKGNANSGIYHVPGASFYTRTKPEQCFATEAEAIAAGYRKAKV